MLKPQRLRRGDTVALVSLSSGIAGEQRFSHRLAVAKNRLERDFGLRVVTMPHAMRGVEYLSAHPQARAEDFMAAFADKRINAVFSMIGGDDTIRLLPFIDFAVLRDNPKIFMGYSDTTVNHFMLYKAGVTSFYGPSVLAEFAENGAMHDYTTQFINNILFEPRDRLPIPPAQQWAAEHLEWTDPANSDIHRKLVPEHRGHELLQGSGTARGTLLGGCVDVLPMLIGTPIWPQREQWAGKILFLETSEEQPSPESVKYLLRGLAAQGIIDSISGIIFGKPIGERYYDEYKAVLLRVVGSEAGRPDLPVLYNMSFGHNAPICILPYGAMAEINCAERSFSLLEAAVL